MSAAVANRRRSLLVTHLREAYMEIFPAPGIEDQLRVLAPHSYVAVTCSPSKGIGETLEMTGRLIERGFRVVPHIAARNVRDMTHLRAIMRRLRDLQIESLFVPGGDRRQPAGEYHSSLQLLRAISEFDHALREIGVAAHPEGHPAVDDDTLLELLHEKQQYAQYMVSQMCFDAGVLGGWLNRVRERDITMPVWLGIPGAIDRSRLLKTSLRIGVGDSLRFLQRQTSAAATLLKSASYTPDDLLAGLEAFQADPAANVAGYHLFCFNQVASTEAWRNEAIEALK